MSVFVYVRLTGKLLLLFRVNQGFFTKVESIKALNPGFVLVVAKVKKGVFTFCTLKSSKKLFSIRYFCSKRKFSKKKILLKISYILMLNLQKN